MEGLIRSLTGEVQAMPTASLAVVDVAIDSWDEIGGGRGTLQAVYHPKEEIAKKQNTA